MSAPAIVVHGGCGRIDERTHEERKLGVRQAAERGLARLRAGESALEAVEAAVAVLEELPLFNAGRGSVLNADGEIETDAALMDGATQAAGAVASLTGFLHPVQVARRVMEASPHVLLCGAGAARFAASQGFVPVAPDELIVAARRAEWEREHGTVGAVACDAQGRVAAATSTGGMTNKLPGRVGDTPLIGCGTWADEWVAVSCTGRGERIMRVTLARLAAFLYEQSGEARAAATGALGELERRVGGDAGLILVDRRGRTAWVKNTPHMPVCAISEAGIQVEV
ncbi:MAG: isoaspartyl peptidase/L-asparaginase family protein [Terriglobales bacterium]